MPCASLFLVLTGLATAAGPTSGDAAPVPQTQGPAPVQAAPPAPPASSGWYGGPAALADAGSTVLLLIAAATKESALAYVSVASLVVAPPINHLVRHHPWRALVSLAVRAALFSASYVTLSKVENGSCTADLNHAPGWCAPAVGLAVAVPLAAMIVDDVWLARDPSPVPPPPRVGLSPGLSLAPGGAFMSLGGAF